MDERESPARSRTPSQRESGARWGDLREGGGGNSRLGTILYIQVLILY